MRYVQSFGPVSAKSGYRVGLTANWITLGQSSAGLGFIVSLGKGRWQDGLTAAEQMSASFTH